MKKRVTERYVQTLQPPAEGRLEVGDDVVAGLWFRVTSKGIKSWSIRSRRDGQAVRFTLGSYPELGLAMARQLALQQIGKIKAGHDPVNDRRRKRNASIRAKTESLSALLDLYVDTILATRKSGKTRARDLRRDLKPLLGRPASLIQRSDLTALIDRKTVTAPISANRLVGYAKPFWRWMHERGYIDENVASELSKPSPETVRERFLDDVELVAVWRACGQTGFPFGPFFKLLLLTAQRRGEVLEMRWGEIDFDKACWTIPGSRTKNGAEHIVHLSAPAQAILRDLGGDSLAEGLLFTTTGVTPISGISKAKARLDKASGITDWRLHDLRRTAVTHMVDLGINPAVADRILNHVAASTMSVVQRAYQRSALLDQRRHALDAWADRVMQLAEGRVTDNIVRLI